MRADVWAINKMSFSVKCKICRSNLLLCHNEDKDIDRCEDSNMLFLGIKDAPLWMAQAIECSPMKKGKLHCSKCKAKVGGFDYISCVSCICKASHGNIWLTKSKTDILKKTSATLPFTQIIEKPPVLFTRKEEQSLCSEAHVSESISCTHQHQSKSPSKVDHTGQTLTENTETTTRTQYTATCCTEISSAEVHPAVAENVRTSYDITASAFEERKNGSQNGKTRGGVLRSKATPVEQVTAQLERIAAHEDLHGNTMDTQEDSDLRKLEKRAESYLCPVCLEVFYSPHQCEPCKHVFCEPCLRQVNASSGSNGYRVRCPLCRKRIRKCQPLPELWRETKALFAAEYEERHKVERKKRRQRAALPGASVPRPGPARRGTHILTVWAGVCFVILFMMLGFTVFATTVGFVAWYFLEVAMDMTVDVTLELQTFIELLKTSIIFLCIEGSLSSEKWKQLSESAGRVIGAFTKLVHTRNISEVALPGWVSSHYQDEAMRAYQILWKMTQTSIANYCFCGALATFILYKLAKYMQARRL